MKNIIIAITSCFMLLSCTNLNTSNTNRKTASHVDLNELTVLGYSEYKDGESEITKPANRIYFRSIPGQTDRYTVVLLEYVDLIEMGVRYIGAEKSRRLSERGFLKNINSKIEIFEAVHTGSDIFLLYDIKIEGNNIVADEESTPRKLILSPDAKSHALEGAIITKAKSSDPERVYFPKISIRESQAKEASLSRLLRSDESARTRLSRGQIKQANKGIAKSFQYSIAKLVYEKVGLESTWRDQFSQGEYLATYRNRKDVVLKLSVQGNRNISEFVINPNATKDPDVRRTEFTNPKSAFLEGKFITESVRPGVFMYRPTGTSASSNQEISSRLGLYIDIFNASKALNQKVDELALIDPANPKDFLMYYEHPENPSEVD